MSDARPELPKINVYTDKPYPELVESAGFIGLSQLVCIQPKIELQADLFLPAGINNSTRVKPLCIINDEALILEVTTEETGVEALQRMKQTIEDIGRIANLWNDPTAYKKVVYPETELNQ